VRSAGIRTADDVERYVREHQPAIIREFMDLVAIPNVRSDLRTSSATPSSCARCSSVAA
jgi:hypothetical protein